MSDKVSVSPSYTELLSVLDEKKTNITVPKTGDVYKFGDLSLEVITVGFSGDESASVGLNNCSIVLRGTFNGTSFLFTGDAEREEETLILSEGRNIKADVLKIGHHGSSSSANADFLSAVSPDYAVISCGAKNDYGHPHKELLDRLEDASVKAFRTDISGCVSFFTDGKKILYKTEII